MPKECGNLYDSYDGALNDQAKAIYEKYLEKLTQLQHEYDRAVQAGEYNALGVWDRGLRELYKEIVYDAFEQNDLRIQGMELYFAGSNAKSQGTLYSDVDAFAIFPEGTPTPDINTAKDIFEKVNRVCNRIFMEKNQLYPDPVGINPAKLCGTPQSLLQLIKDPELILDQGPIVASIMSSRPILGEGKEGIKLKGLIERDDELRVFHNARTFYDKAINDFTAPSPDAEEIHIKRHITRPIDFILMGLRTEFSLDEGDGQVLSAEQTLLALHEEARLPPKELTLLSRAHKRATELRFETHRKAGRESDKVGTKTDGVRELLDDVDKLREIFKPRLHTLSADTVTGHPSPEPPSPPKSQGLSSGKKWGIGALIMMGIGIAIGAALCATGVFAPFGVGVLGIVAMGACGAGAGLLGTGLAKAGTSAKTALGRPRGYSSVAASADTTPSTSANILSSPGSYGEMTSSMPPGPDEASHPELESKPQEQHSPTKAKRDLEEDSLELPDDEGKAPQIGKGMT